VRPSSDALQLKLVMQGGSLISSTYSDRPQTTDVNDNAMQDDQVLGLRQQSTRTRVLKLGSTWERIGDRFQYVVTGKERLSGGNHGIRCQFLSLH
jgi:hypothetical protein